MRTAVLMLSSLLLGCGSGDKAEQLVRDAFAEANPPGRTGVEIGGKGVWYSAPFFEGTCLTDSDLAHKDNPASRPHTARDVLRISPRYETQNFVTTSTAKGWCLYIGSDPSLEVVQTSPTGNTYLVEVQLSMAEPSPYWHCMSSAATNPTLEVVKRNGELVLESDVTLFRGECPHPLPGGEERVATTRPWAAPPAPPTMEQVRALARDFDDALYRLDFATALSMVSCFNLHEDQKYGTCSVGELVAVGPQFATDTGPQHGVPWLEYGVDSPADFQSVEADRDDPTMFHVSMQHRRSKTRRTFAVQWADGKWKLVGVIGQLAEGLTHARFLYDLDREEKREVFESRFKGAEVDEQGNPTDPYHDYELK